MNKSMPEPARYGTTEPEFHYAWCDTPQCHPGEQGEAGVFHVSAPIVWADGDVSVQAIRFRATWSGTEGSVSMVFHPAAVEIPIDTNESFGFSQWVRQAQMKLAALTVAQPPAIPCPEWCEGEASKGGKGAWRHDWHFDGPLQQLDGTWYAAHWERLHHGRNGKVYLEQWEYVAMDGTVRRSRATNAGRVKAVA